MTDASAKLREAKDRLDQSSYLVGYFYYRQRWYPGAIDRFKSILKEDGGFTNRDALYYYLADSIVKLNRERGEAEALPYLERLVQEFEQSEYLQKAQQKIDEIKASQAKQATK